MACFWFEYLLLKRQDAYSPDLLHLFANAESLSFRTRYRNAFRHGRAAPNRGFRGIIVDKHALRSLRCTSIGPLIPRVSRERSTVLTQRTVQVRFPTLSKLYAQAEHHSRNLIFSQIFNVSVWLAGIELSHESTPCAGDTRKYGP